MHLRLSRYLIAFAVLPVANTAIVDAAAPHQTRHPQSHRSVPSNNNVAAAAAAGYAAPNNYADALVNSVPHISVSSSAIRRRRDPSPYKRQSTDDYCNQHTPYYISDDVSALATLAPAQAVGAPTPRLRSSPTAGSGLASQHSARSLGDWEVEDFFLMATVDGDLYAADRKTGQERWRLEVEQPMIETTHYRLNSSYTDEDFNIVDHYIWAVEPSEDGSLYIWVPGDNSLSGAQVIKTGLTMKMLVEDLAPFADADQAVVYVGSKVTTLITLDAATGRVLKWFGESGSHLNEPESCLRPTDFFISEECGSTGIIQLGRTEYTIAIQREDGKPVALLKYREWGPNNFNMDLVQQYQASRVSFDDKYITSRHDGKVFGLDYGFDEQTFHDTNRELGSTTFARKLPSAVARVYDICRPRDVAIETNPELIVLSQPAPPPKNSREEQSRSTSIYLNKTQAGNWFALSGQSYPMILTAPVALISMDSLLEMPRHLEYEALCKALAGTHTLNTGKNTSKLKQYVPLIESGDKPQSKVESSYEYIDYVKPSVDINMADPPTLMDRAVSFPLVAIMATYTYFFDLFINPAFFFLICVAMFYWQDEVRRMIRQQIKHRILGDAGSSRKRTRKYITPMEECENLFESPEIAKQPEIPLSGIISESVEDDKTTDTKTTDDKTETEVSTKVLVKPSLLPTPPVTSPEPEEAQPVEVIDPHTNVLAPPTPIPRSVSPVLSDQTSPASPPPEPLVEAPVETPVDVPTEAPTLAKKKAHRGRRGGVKHKKKKRDPSQPRDEVDASESVENAVQGALKIPEHRNLPVEPDVHSIIEDPENLSNPRLRMGQLEVDMDNQLGTGSNGTLVFAGRFDGREVAVKRMLIQFYDIASQETRLLRESDDHPNVIRYYSQQSRDGFLYIALERCVASLADVIEKPDMFRQIAIAGSSDIPSVLYQITNGIRHLHSLRIVHRDLKPQNILVNMGSDGKPRLLVSDFGLCKKLEGGQSSFGATTGRAAGTSGWRAPELLVDDDPRDSMETSIHSGSGTVLVGDGLSPRRATRSIDIFSLGLVFYYVLSGGHHPFDCGGRYMREVNIRKGQYNLDRLQSLGEIRYEAEDLIKSMLNPHPKERPTAQDILAHPFFWSSKKRLAFLADVSDHFEKEPRDPPSEALQHLESYAPEITKGDFLRVLPREFIESLGKQRKYTGSRMLDLLRALRNKKNHYEDMSNSLKKMIGSLPEGYLYFWTTRFPVLLLSCWNIVYDLGWDNTDRFREYYEPTTGVSVP